jgi:hypothetical protein
MQNVTGINNGASTKKQTSDIQGGLLLPQWRKEISCCLKKRKKIAKKAMLAKILNYVTAVTLTASGITFGSLATKSVAFFCAVLLSCKRHSISCPSQAVESVAPNQLCLKAVEWIVTFQLSPYQAVVSVASDQLSSESCRMNI